MQQKIADLPVMSKCFECEVKKPKTTEFFYMGIDGLCKSPDCRECYLKSKKSFNKNCAFCHKPFNSKRKNQKFCINECRWVSEWVDKVYYQRHVCCRFCRCEFSARRTNYCKGQFCAGNYFKDPSNIDRYDVILVGNKLNVEGACKHCGKNIRSSLKITTCSDWKNCRKIKLLPVKRVYRIDCMSDGTVIETDAKGKKTKHPIGMAYASMNYLITKEMFLKVKPSWLR